MARVLTNPGTELPDLHKIVESDDHVDRMQADEPKRIEADLLILLKDNP